MPKLTYTPLDKLELKSPDGIRTDPVTGIPNSIHGGVDLKAQQNTSVYAAHSGKVIKVGTEKDSNGKVVGYGNYVVLYNGSTDTVTLYAHLSSANVALNQEITQDQVDNGFQIALSGNTGKSTGPHLHFEVMKGSQLLGDGKTTIAQAIKTAGQNEPSGLGIVKPDNIKYKNIAAPREIASNYLADLALRQALSNLADSDPSYRDSEGNLKPLDQLTKEQQESLKAAANDIFPSSYNLPDPFLDEGMGQITLDGKDIYESLAQGENNKIYIGDYELSGKGICLVDPNKPNEGEHSWLVKGSNDNKDYALYRINDNDQKDPNGKDLLIVPLPQTETKNSIRVTNFNFERALSDDNSVGIKLGYQNGLMGGITPFNFKSDVSDLNNNPLSALALIDGDSKVEGVVSVKDWGKGVVKNSPSDLVGSNGFKVTVYDKNGFETKNFELLTLEPNYPPLVPLAKDGKFLALYRKYDESDLFYSCI